MFLIVCALGALVALGAIAPVAFDGDVPLRVYAAPVVPRSLEPPSTQAPSPGALIQPALATNIARRFPELHLTPPAQSILANQQIVSYYGNPYTADMGILGSADPETIAKLLEQRAQEYDRLNGRMGVVPALHLVYAVAQYHEADDGLYLQHVDKDEVDEYIRIAEEHNMLLFLDLQIGRSSVETELQKVLPYLRNPRVHLALDPEFAVAAGQVPGTDLGSLDGIDINSVQETLAGLVEREELPPKLLVVHQFLDSMVLDGNAIERYPNVDLIIDMDGFGPAAVKRAKYEQYATRPYAAHGAIKLFLQHDPDLMSAAEVLALKPTPSVIIYQ